MAKVIVPQLDKTHSRLYGQFTEGRVFQIVDKQTKIQQNRKMNKTKKDIKIFIIDPTKQISAFLLESGKSISLPKKRGQFTKQTDIKVMVFQFNKNRTG